MMRMRRTYIFALLVAAFLPWMMTGQADAASFNDIDDEHPYADAIVWLKEYEYIQGFADGSFRADRTVTRAEALKIIVLATAEEDDAGCKRSDLPYTDVSSEDWFAPYVCAALERGIIVPSEGDSLLRPGDPVNLAETAMILTRAETLTAPESADEPWFASSIRALGNARAIPAELRAYGERVTRGQLAEILWRVGNNVTDRAAADPEAIIAAACTWFEQEDIPHVDRQEIARHWMQWVNGERTMQGLPPYRASKHLARTAAIWSVSARNAGAITHKRAGQTAYYDYAVMTDWFEGNDIAFANSGGSTFTENIGWGVYRCPASGDCTAAFTDAVRTTFDFYMSEKNKPYRPHYNSIVNADFRLAGLGIAVDEARGRYYLTAHYGTDVTSSPSPVCP